MTKKHKKPSRQKHSINPNFKQKPAVLLSIFKSLWVSNKWVQALSCYRTWTNRTGEKRNPAIEGELLFRCASSAYCSGSCEQSLKYLEEAITRNPDNISRYNFYKAICLAKNGQLSDSMKLWEERKDVFYQLIISYYSEQERHLPKVLDNDVAIEKSQLLSFWRNLTEPGNKTVIKTSNNALKNIGKAFLVFSARGDPEPQLKLLRKKTGFDSLAAYLLLLSAISKRRIVRARNLIKKNPFIDLIDIHINILFREKNYDEIVRIDKLLKEKSIKSYAIDLLHDELLFNLGFKEIEANRSENALNYFLDIKNKTPAVLHNTALLYQKTNRYEKANRIWIQRLKQEKKPKKSDAEEIVIPYTITCKYIARNFMDIGQLKEAQKYFKEVLTLVKDDREALDTLITISDELDNRRDALLYSERLYNLEPGNEEFLFTYIMELQRNKKLGTLVPLYKKGLEIDPDNYLYREGLAFCYITKALEVRQKDTKEAKRLMKETGKLGYYTGLLKYLEGYFLLKRGKKEEAGKKFRQALKKADDHYEHFRLGIYFYETGLMDLAFETFKVIVSCGCITSRMIFEMIVGFLVKKDDKENTIRMCDYCLVKLNYSLYDIADVLFTNKKPFWARLYSSRLVELNNIDEEDKYLHLLILNEIREKDELLEYLERFSEKAEQEGDSESVCIYKEITRQVKKRGRFKYP